MPKELPLPYVGIDPLLQEHPRTAELADALDIDDIEASQHIVGLLLYAGRMAARGNLGRPSARKLARASFWRGEPQKWFDALIATRWLVVSSDEVRAELSWPEYLDSGEDGDLLIRSWHDHGGQALKKRHEWRNQKRRKRKTKKDGGCPPDIPGKGGGVRPDTLRTSDGSPVNVRGSPPLKVKGGGEGELGVLPNKNMDGSMSNIRTRNPLDHLAGNHGEHDRDISLRQLNHALEQAWSWPIGSKWKHRYEALLPISTAEFRSALAAVQRTIDDRPDGRPNPGLLLTKLEDERREPSPRKQTTRQVSVNTSKQGASMRAAYEELHGSG